MPKINFRFRKATVAAARDAVLAELKARGATESHPLFPDTADAELATMYVAEAVDDAAAKTLVAHLNGTRAVAFAELQPARKLVGKQER